MHQTTVRFGSDLWEALERESAEAGISIAQYVREATLTRLVYAAGRRGDDVFETALAAVTGRAVAPAETAAELEHVAGPVSAGRSAKERTARRDAETAATAAEADMSRLHGQRQRESAEKDRRA
jgi:hypothetical protein